VSRPVPFGVWGPTSFGVEWGSFLGVSISCFPVSPAVVEVVEFWRIMSSCHNCRRVSAHVDPATFNPSFLSLVLL
jgi:hypothetical protein